MKTPWGGFKYAFVVAVFCFVILVPAVRADVLYDFNSHYTGTFTPFEFQFHESQFLTSSTTIPLADITVIQNPSIPLNCSVAGATLNDPGSSTFSVGIIWSPGCAGQTSNITFLDGPAVSDGVHDLDNKITLTISGSPTTPAVPEPSSMVLLGTGLLGFAGTIRRKLNR